MQSMGIDYGLDKKQEIIEEQAKTIRRLESELKQQQGMKDEFLSLISHEFRTPLSVISTAIQAMNTVCGNELSDRAKVYLEMIRMNTFRQIRLVSNLLDITLADADRLKINKKNIDIVFVTKSITEAINNYASQKGINVTFTSQLEKKIIGIDDEKYDRILLNLLSNAIKYTPAGKSIDVRLFTKKENICVEVKDKGIGIPEDKAAVIFEKFGQVDSSLSRQAEGAGVGLTLVKKFVEALGGSISVKSKPGRGSTFTILLPAEIEASQQYEKETVDSLYNRIIKDIKLEFSDIYL
jgi:signal transduction histidine kinase